jgi:uncharacterized protein DUF6487
VGFSRALSLDVLRKPKPIYDGSGKGYSMEERTGSGNGEGSKCARCGGNLEDGYAMAPKGLWWDKVPHKVTWFGTGAEKIISQWSLTMPNAPAQRCYNCNIVIVPVG